MSGIGEFGTIPKTVTRPPNGLPEWLRDVDFELYAGDEAVDEIRCHVNRLRLWAEDFAVDMRLGILSGDTRLAAIRELARELALATEGALAAMKDARGLIHKRARAETKRRQEQSGPPSAPSDSGSVSPNVIPFRRPEPGPFAGDT